MRPTIEMLPHLARPNLIARLYMLFVAQGTVEIAWLIPSSATTRIVESGGSLAAFVLMTMTAAVVVGLLDVLLNDVGRADTRWRGIGGAPARWLRAQRINVCYVVGGCYLVQAYAGLGSEVQGTIWLLIYYTKIAILGLGLAWSLRYLAAAEDRCALHRK